MDKDTYYQKYKKWKIWTDIWRTILGDKNNLLWLLELKMPNSILLKVRKYEQVILITFWVIKENGEGGGIAPHPLPNTGRINWLSPIFTSRKCKNAFNNIAKQNARESLDKERPGMQFGCNDLNPEVILTNPFLGDLG